MRWNGSPVLPGSWFVRVVWVALLSFGASLPVSAADLLPADRPVAEVIDHYIDATLAKAKITAAPSANDENLVRRVMLDLVGRIPTPVERREFVDSKATDKLPQLVDRLLKSPEFVDHQVNEFDWMLMQGSGNLRDYLTTAFREGRTWEQMFRELLLADEVDPKAKPPIDFVKTRVKDLDRLTNDVSSLFFGVNISCAQCHDHPLAKDWKQDHFYGLKSFVSRTYENGGFIGEKDYGLVSYLTPKGEQRQAKLMFLSGKLIDEPEKAEPDNKAKKAEQDELKKRADKKEPPPKPSFSRRAKLVEVALQPEERHFLARSIVNRIWARLIGYGLVMPVDQMHSGNPASHPELLDWLARDMAHSHFDLGRLMRGIVLSRTYARSSRWESSARPDAALFAVAQVRPLTPYQYGAALKLATTDPDMWKTLKSADDVAKRASDTARAGRSWASLFQPVSDNFQVSVSESLMMANDTRVMSEFLGDGGNQLVGRLKAIDNAEQQVECAVSTVLGRLPEAEERQAITGYLLSRKDRSIDALRQVVWSLITGSEFRFNY
ncbi:MAG: DUF1549 domain-containing protein [Planctomycetaceae bacterium]|nr:DUF1549 domain-containing protein [Planctomycetaceae bacterium]